MVACDDSYMMAYIGSVPSPYHPKDRHQEC